MRIKKYIAKSMREALLQIKDELGEDAIILKTRKLPKKVFALGAQEDIEVTAAVDEDTSARGHAETFKPLKMSAETGVYSRPRSSNIIDADNLPADLDIRPWNPQADTKIGRRVSPQPVSTTMPGKQKEAGSINELKEDLRELKELIKNVVPDNTGIMGSISHAPVVTEIQDDFNQCYKRLIDSEVRPDIADTVMKTIHKSASMPGANPEKKIISVLTNSFAVSGPLKLKKDGPVIVAFVGPTGSGKTTTLAKLAAHCCLNKQKNVSIITADTYRIAAIEQIRMFADIVKVGLQVVFSPEEIPAALENCANDDVVFVDTAGRSQRNMEHMEDLKALIASLHPDEVHLVMSAATKDSDLADIVQRYRSINVNRLLFTKLDETVRIGNIFNVANLSGIPVSYFTFGQSVPDDIELAQSGRFVQRLWEGKSL
jgi:flagellar biosynthesis protein FlhF